MSSSFCWCVSSRKKWASMGTGCSQCAVVSIYQKSSSEGTVVIQWHGHGRPRLTDASIRTGPRSNKRRWAGLMTHVSFYIMWMVCVCATKMGNTRRQNYWRKEGISQLTGLANLQVSSLLTVAKILFPNTTAYFQGAIGVHVLIVQGYFVSKRGTNTI